MRRRRRRGEAKRKRAEVARRKEMEAMLKIKKGRLLFPSGTSRNGCQLVTLASGASSGDRGMNCVAVVGLGRIFVVGSLFARFVRALSGKE
jgi:hypothetical protein